MVSAVFQMLGAALGIIGWIVVIVVCALPQWKVTAFIGENIMTQNLLEGMWKVCVIQSRGQIQCTVYDSMLDPPQHLHAARDPIISIMMVGILLAVVRGKCTNCVEDERAKSGIGVGKGLVIIAVVLCLIAFCWSANTIIRDPLQTRSQKMELGATLYIGWGGAAPLMIMGGGFLCANCSCKEDNYHTKYPVIY